MRFFHANGAKLEAQGIKVDEWDKATIEAGKPLPEKVPSIVRDYRHLAAKQAPPKLPATAHPVPDKAEYAGAAPQFTSSTKKTTLTGALLFFIGCWFLLWCMLGLYLAANTSGSQPDTDLGTIAEIITFISVVATVIKLIVGKASGR
jgi:hypothetical protein